MINFGKDKAYMEVLNAFRKLIDEEYREGGWLPPVREMSERYNVSTVTYRKATNCLVSESIAESFPGKGIYIIPKQYRPKKIGLVIKDGQESPFIFQENVFIGILERLRDREYSCHQIQGSPVTNVFRSALTHCVSGLIWVDPSPVSFQVLQSMGESGSFPFVAVSPFLPASARDLLPKVVPEIKVDYPAICEVLAGKFKSRGHKRVGCVGWSAWRTEYSGLGPALREAGIEFKEEYCIQDCIHSPGELARLVKSEKLTGLAINAQTRSIEAAFSELSQLPGEEMPEVLIHNSRIPDELIRRYPAGKVIACWHNDSSELAVAAVDMLLDNLDIPDKIRSIDVMKYEFKEI